MLIELAILVFGLLASYLFIRLVYPDQEMIKLIVSTITIFMCFMVLFGYYLGRFGLPLFSVHLLIIFLLISVLLITWISLKNPHLLRSIISIKADKKYSLGFIFILAVGFLVHILPSLPSFFPVGRNCDTFAHFAVTKFITEHNSLLFGDNPVYALNPHLNNYPFGMHLNIAFFSRLFNIDPITVIYPFVVFFSVLTAAMLYGMVVESKAGDKFYGIFPAFVVLAFYLPMYMLRVMGWWPQIFGIFLAVMFVWLLMDYIKKPNIIGILPLALVEIAIVFTYIHWVTIAGLTLLLALTFMTDISKKNKLIHLFTFVLITSIFTASYALIMIKWAGMGLGVSSEAYHWTYIRFLPFDFFGIRVPESHTFFFDAINSACTLLFTISILGAIKSYIGKKNSLLLFFFFASLLQTFLLLIGVLFFDLRAYPYAKQYYMLSYPAAIFFFIGLMDFVSRFNITHSLKDSTAFKAIFIIALIAIVVAAGQVMSIGVKATGHQELAIAPDQYDVALWCKNNLPAGNLTYFAEMPQSLWFYVASEHPPSSSELIHGVDISAKFNEWATTAENGDIVVVLNKDKIGLIDKSKYEILYERGNAAVLSKNEVKNENSNIKHIPG